MPKKTVEELWHGILTAQDPLYRYWGLYRRLQAMIPASRRCKNCHAPFTGIASVLMRVVGKGPYNKNPRFCNW